MPLPAAIAHAGAIGIPFTITTAITVTSAEADADGRVVAVKRMDGAALVSIDDSAAKARTSVFFGAATHDLQPEVPPGGCLCSLADASVERLTFVGGGVPVLVDGEIVGGIGVD